MQNEAESQGIDIFRIPLEGWIVECESVEDAIAVTNANAILSNQSTFAYAPADLEQLADVLLRYGRQTAVDTLKRLASRMRAAAFLKDSIGYETPS
jgi:hypothetical protein